MKSEKIYSGKRVLITGHTGFKGSWLTLWMKVLGAQVIGYSLDPVNDYDNFNLAVDKNSITDIRGDIRDKEKLEEVFQKYSPEIIFHLAAQPLVGYSFEHPKYTYEVNVMGTLNILDCFRKCENTKAAVIVTSDKCYKNNEWCWGYRENDPLGGYDPYSSSKACIEILVSSYRDSFFNIKEYSHHKKAITTVRAGNVIGGGDWSKDRIIPDCIRSLEKNIPISIRNPNSIRPWQHVLEPLNGYIELGALLLEGNPELSGSWNFGPDPESTASVEEVVNKIINFYGTGSYICSSLNNKAFHETKVLRLDISKARNKLNWRPKWSLEKALENTVKWYKNYKSCDVNKLCIDTINQWQNPSLNT
ncbi:CDP-glucose 4,6-dehydratase [Clostridium polynesiense]|uniref:CDP-glucose 4,6-dehydratase n=1 Tax=Clostridium polynesiense TaxID=1325933 RepID=UPI000590D2A2|nr:CDP-glucose 4,6-dehydratase [Clostridium polynesiense]